jgi:hypothetical protein
VSTRLVRQVEGRGRASSGNSTGATGCARNRPFVDIARLIRSQYGEVLDIGPNMRLSPQESTGLFEGDIVNKDAVWVR